MFLTNALNQVRSLTRMNIIDNSKQGIAVKEAGKFVKVIRIYNKSKHQMGGLGDKVLVTLLGQMYKGVVVGCKQTQRTMIPRLDKNNLVLIDNQNVPLGTRVLGPLPNRLRKQGALTARLMAIGTRFI